jgi:hypothetical protein
MEHDYRRGFRLIIGFNELFKQLVTTLYKSLSHTDYCSPSRSSLAVA